MLRPTDFFRYVIALASLLAFAAHAQGHVADLQEREAQRWLRKIPLAAQTLDYSGTFLHQRSDRVYTSRITHVVQGQDELEKLEVLDGRPREYVRMNDEVVYYAPDKKAMLVEPRATRVGFPALMFTDPAQLSSFYRIYFDKAGQVAGYPCQVLVLVPRDNLRYGYRLWIEKSSGLLLKMQTLADDQVIEQIGFTQLVLGNIPLQSARPTHNEVQDWRYERRALQHIEMPGLKVGFLPSGFTQIASVRSSIPFAASDVTDKGAQAVKAREVVQIVFSDGLAAISIFLHPGSPPLGHVSAQQGSIHIIGKRFDDFSLIIVGEIPALAIKQVADSIEIQSIK